MRLLPAIAVAVACLAGCATAHPIPDEPLTDRYWRALEIGGKPVAVGNNRAEPHVVLAGNGKAHGSDGCNRFSGSYEASSGLRFGNLASTMMACLPPLEEQARRFARELQAATAYRIGGRTLELLDAGGAVRMRLEATALR